MASLFVGIPSAGRKEILSHTIQHLSQQAVRPDRVILCTPDDEDENEEEVEAMRFQAELERTMGFVSFASTKGKKVDGNYNDKSFRPTTPPVISTEQFTDAILVGEASDAIYGYLRIEEAGEDLVDRAKAQGIQRQ